MRVQSMKPGEIAASDLTRVCPAGYLSVNRAYTRRAAQNDSNHRFTTSDSTIKEMGDKGWGVEGTVMCARP